MPEAPYVLHLPRLVGSAEAARQMAMTLPPVLNGKVVLIEGRDCAQASATFCESLVQYCMARGASSVIVRGAPTAVMDAINSAVWKYIGSAAGAEPPPPPPPLMAHAVRTFADGSAVFEAVEVSSLNEHIQSLLSNDYHRSVTLETKNNSSHRFQLAPLSPPPAGGSDD